MTALEEWERYCAKHFATETTDYAEAAIAELRAENADLKAHRQTVRENNVRLQAALNEAEAEVERLKQSRPEGHAMNLSERLAAVDVEVPEVEAVTGDNHIWAWGNEGRNYEALYAALAALVGVIERQHSGWYRQGVLDIQAENARLKAEVERLECCGNCAKYRMPPGTLSWECDHLRTKHGDQTWGHHTCHFTPSRWQPREEKA